jgi:hypothetical protein
MTKESKHQCFSNWWRTIPVGSEEKIRIKVMESCFISYSIFRHWLKGRTEIPEIALSAIEAIAGRKIFTIDQFDKKDFDYEYECALLENYA